MRKTDIGFRRFLAVLLIGFLGLMSLFVPPASAQEKRLPDSRAEAQLSFAPLVKQVSPAVVNIYTKKVVRQRTVSPLFQDPFFRRFFGDSLPMGPERERVQKSLGSGVIVRADGIIVTNHHVIEGADEITVILPDKREYAANLILSDDSTDLAFLRIDTEGEELPRLRFGDSDDLEVGDLVLAIGNPFGVGQTVTSGIVSALARTAVSRTDYQFFIQTDAAINPGNSGGALVTMDGRLVGINSAIYSKSGGSLGIGFAIPANMVQALLSNALAGGQVVRPWFGASGQPVTADVAQSIGIDRPRGVLINEIFPKGPAEKAGLKIGDVVLSIDGREVQDPAALRFRIATREVGGKATLLVLRAGRERSLQVDLVTAPETPERNITSLEGRNPLGGAIVGNLSPAFAIELGLPSMANGVIVLRVPRNSLAKRFGLQAGDIVLEVNGQKIALVSDLIEVLKQKPEGWIIDIKREGRILSLKVPS